MLSIGKIIASEHRETEYTGLLLSGSWLHLSTDQQKADLIKLCTQNFGRYAQGKKKFFEGMQKLYKDTYGTNPNVMGYGTWIAYLGRERKR